MDRDDLGDSLPVPLDIKQEALTNEKTQEPPKRTSRRSNGHQETAYYDANQNSQLFRSFLPNCEPLGGDLTLQGLIANQSNLEGALNDQDFAEIEKGLISPTNTHLHELPTPQPIPLPLHIRGSMSSMEPLFNNPRRTGSEMNDLLGNSNTVTAIPRSASFPQTTPTKSPTPTIKKKKAAPKTDKAAKGLRHFSLLVMQKVQEKGETTYNEVADELVVELQDGAAPGKKKNHNIRRRVYDALNVLRAIKVIDKQKKTISWIGLQHSPQSVELLHEQKKEMLERIAQKKEQLKDLEQQCEIYESVVTRNRHFSQTEEIPEDKRIPVPFVLVSTQLDCKIECEILENRTEYNFVFEKPFNLFTDVQLLEMMDIKQTAHFINQSLSLEDDVLISPHSLQANYGQQDLL